MLDNSIEALLSIYETRATTAFRAQNTDVQRLVASVARATVKLIRDLSLVLVAHAEKAHYCFSQHTVARVVNALVASQQSCHTVERVAQLWVFVCHSEVVARMVGLEDSNMCDRILHHTAAALNEFVSPEDVERRISFVATFGPPSGTDAQQASQGGGGGKEPAMGGGMRAAAGPDPPASGPAPPPYGSAIEAVVPKEGTVPKEGAVPKEGTVGCNWLHQHLLERIAAVAADSRVAASAAGSLLGREGRAGPHLSLPLFCVVGGAGEGGAQAHHGLRALEAMTILHADTIARASVVLSRPGGHVLLAGPGVGVGDSAAIAHTAAWLCGYHVEEVEGWEGEAGGWGWVREPFAVDAGSDPDADSSSPALTHQNSTAPGMPVPMMRGESMAQARVVSAGSDESVAQGRGRQAIIHAIWTAAIQHTDVALVVHVPACTPRGEPPLILQTLMDAILSGSFSQVPFLQTLHTTLPSSRPTLVLHILP